MRISDWSSDVCSSDLDIAEALAAQAPDEIVLADTIGVAVPTQVTALIAAIRARIGDRVVLRGHFHNTRNTAIANIVAALQAGVPRFDASVGGVGEIGRAACRERVCEYV